MAQLQGARSPQKHLMMLTVVAKSIGKQKGPDPLSSYLTIQDVVQWFWTKSTQITTSPITQSPRAHDNLCRDELYGQIKTNLSVGRPHDTLCRDLLYGSPKTNKLPLGWAHDNLCRDLSQTTVHSTGPTKLDQTPPSNCSSSPSNRSSCSSKTQPKLNQKPSPK